jgi:hypothetical protein
LRASYRVAHLVAEAKANLFRWGIGKEMIETHSARDVYGKINCFFNTASLSRATMNFKILVVTHLINAETKQNNLKMSV